MTTPTLIITGEDLKDDVLEFPSKIEKTDDKLVKSFGVKVDDSETNGSFTYETSGGDWFFVLREGNKLTVTVKENFNVDERAGSIVLRHNLVYDLVKVVTVSQSGVNCGIKLKSETGATKETMTINGNETDVYTYELKTNPENFVKETKEIEIQLAGGNEKYYVASVTEYKQQLGDARAETYIRISNDGGINVIPNQTVHDMAATKADEGDESEEPVYPNRYKKLIIESYGRIFLESVTNGTTTTYLKNYYLVTLCHANDPEKTLVLKFKYDDATIKEKLELKSSETRKAPKRKVKEINVIPHEIIFAQQIMENYVPPTMNVSEEGRKRESAELVFPATGGEKRLIVDVEPENAQIMVSLSSDFVHYMIDGHIVTLTAQKNNTGRDRVCKLRILSTAMPFSPYEKYVRLRTFKEEEEKPVEK